MNFNGQKFSIFELEIFTDITLVISRLITLRVLLFLLGDESSWKTLGSVFDSFVIELQRSSAGEYFYSLVEE